MGFSLTSLLLSTLRSLTRDLSKSESLVLPLCLGLFLSFSVWLPFFLSVLFHRRVSVPFFHCFFLQNSFSLTSRHSLLWSFGLFYSWLRTRNLNRFTSKGTIGTLFTTTSLTFVLDQLYPSFFFFSIYLCPICWEGPQNEISSPFITAPLLPYWASFTAQIRPYDNLIDTVPVTRQSSLRRISRPRPRTSWNDQDRNWKTKDLISDRSSRVPSPIQPFPVSVYEPSESHRHEWLGRS